MKDGEKDLVAHLVEQDRVETKPHAAEGGKRIMPEIALQSVAAIRYAATHGELVLIVGPAGSLKTTAARAAAAEIPGAVYASMTTPNASGLGVLKVLAEAMGLPVGEHPNSSDLFGELVKALRGTGRLLIIDEIHKLGAWRKDEGLHVLRDLMDTTGCGMAWLGMPTIARYIRDGHAQGLETLDQVYSRIALWLDLTEAASQAGGGGDPGGDGAAGVGGGAGGGLVTVADIRAMLAARKLRYTGEALRYLLALGREEGAGAFRTIDKVLAFAEVVARGGEITRDMLAGIQARRLGMRAAENLENRMAVRMPQKASVA